MLGCVGGTQIVYQIIYYTVVLQLYVNTWPLVYAVAAIVGAIKYNSVDACTAYMYLHTTTMYM